MTTFFQKIYDRHLTKIHMGYRSTHQFLDVRGMLLNDPQWHNQ
jgi:hypothetical protein